MHSKILLVIVTHDEYLPLLPRALQSVSAQQLEPTRLQTVVVLNGCAHEPSASLTEALSQVGVATIVTDGVSLGAARNVAIARVDSEYIAFCDADDWLNEKAMTILARHLEWFPTTDAIQSDCWLADLGVNNRVDGRDEYTRAYKPETMAGAMLRRSAVERLGGFADRTRGDTQDFWSRFHMEHLRRSRLQGPPLYYYRQHDEQMHRQAV